MYNYYEYSGYEHKMIELRCPLDNGRIIGTKENISCELCNTLFPKVDMYLKKAASMLPSQPAYAENLYAWESPRICEKKLKA